MMKISEMTEADLARRLDYSVLTHHADVKYIDDAFEYATDHLFAAVYVLPNYLDYAVSQMGDFFKKNNVRIGCGPSFPFGCELTEHKLFGTEQILNKGCTSVDLMTNISALKDKRYDYYFNEIKQVVDMAHAAGAICKVITEVCYLTEEEMNISTRLVAEADADYVKLATGQGPKGIPSVDYEVPYVLNELAELRKEGIGMNTKLKLAAVNSPKAQNAFCFLNAGVDIIGTQSAKQIIAGLKPIQALNIFR